MSNAHAVLKVFRKLHLYIGVFTAPMLLFFALTGALQTFSLHETTQGSAYKPPAWIAMLAQIHKKQTDIVPVKKPKAPDTPKSDAAKSDKTSTDATAPKPPAAPPKSHLPLKIFFLIVAVGLFTSTLTGIYMAYKYNSSKLVVTLLLMAGAVIPVLLLPF